MMVEFSTVRDCFVTSKACIEANDMEDSNETEDVSEDIAVEKFYVENHYFSFKESFFIRENYIGEYIHSSITSPFRVIDSPPPQAVVI